MDRLICAAFPRTASTYFTESLKVAYPKADIFHSFHKIEILRKESNIVTIIRKPEGAVASWLTKLNEEEIEANLDWYDRFMIATLNRDDIFVTDFDSVIFDVNAVILECQEFYSLDEPKTVDTKEIVKHLKKNFPDRISKEQNLALQKKVIESPSYGKSIDLFNEVFDKMTEKKRTT